MYRQKGTGFFKSQIGSIPIVNEHAKHDTAVANLKKMAEQQCASLAANQSTTNCQEGGCDIVRGRGIGVLCETSVTFFFCERSPVQVTHGRGERKIEGGISECAKEGEYQKKK